MCVLPGYTHAQFITISGYITHALTGVAIENVSVFEKHTEIGTISNKDGSFKLMLHPGRLNLSFSENGYKTFSENLVLKSDTTLVIQLKPELSAKNRHRNIDNLQAGLDKRKTSDEDKRF
jgi:plasmid rolling circle replication initiator protein Rep